MNKEERIKRYGEAAYEKLLEQGQERTKRYHEEHLEQRKGYNKKYDEEHPEQVKARQKKYREEHREEQKAHAKKYREEHPEEVKAINHKISRKGGKRYAKNLVYKRTGLQGERNKIRMKHGRKYKPYKDIIAPESQIHHEWIARTSEYRGVALVEKDQHMHGIVDVIEILAGEITLLTEEEVRKG